MAEDTGIFLVALRITGDLTIFIDILGEGRVVKHHTMLALQVFLAGVESLSHHAVLSTNLCHRTPTLALNEDLRLLTLVGADLIAEEVVGTEIPLTIPSVFLHGGNHSVDGGLHTLRFLGVLRVLGVL